MHPYMFYKKNFKWNNNTCCSKIKTIWKLNFPDHFISLLALLTKTKLNVSKPQNVKPTDSFPELRKRMAIKQLISVSGYTKIQHGLYCPSVWKDINKQICKENLSKLGCCQITQEKMVNVFESNNDRKYRRWYRSFLKHRNNWAQYNNVCMTVVRRVEVLTVFRNQFVLYKSFSSYFQILILILVDRSVCWVHLGIICFCYGLVLSPIFWNKKRKNVENTDVLIFL